MPLGWKKQFEDLFNDGAVGLNKINEDPAPPPTKSFTESGSKLILTSDSADLRWEAVNFGAIIAYKDIAGIQVDATGAYFTHTKISSSAGMPGSFGNDVHHTLMIWTTGSNTHSGINISYSTVGNLAGMTKSDFGAWSSFATLGGASFIDRWFKIYWNISGGALTTQEGDTLNNNSFRLYHSTDGSNYSVVAGNTALPFTPTRLGLSLWSGGGVSNNAIMESEFLEFWEYTELDTGPPTLDNYEPNDNSTVYPKNTNITFSISDDNTVLLDSVIIEVNGDVIFSGESFVSGWNTSSYSPNINNDGYDFTLIKTGGFSAGEEVEVNIIADDYIPNTLDASFSFFIGEEPQFLNKSPTPNEKNVSGDTIISFDVVDADATILPSSIIVKINGNTAYDGYDFIFPYNAENSSVSAVDIDGNQGFHIEVDGYGLHSGLVVIDVSAMDSYDYVGETRWAFIVDKFNMLYYCDGYGVKAINTKDLVGESQSKARISLSAETFPYIPTNEFSYLHSKVIDGDLYLAGSTDQGAIIVKNEFEDMYYAEGSNIDKAQITNDGKLYLINKDLNRIEVYYGIHIQEDGRSPDYIYNTTSTPDIFDGDILDLRVVSEKSSRSSGKTRLYISTTLGATRIETWDAEDPDGYSAGLDNTGISYNYGIVGSGAQHEVIGGTSAECILISSNDEEGVMLVATPEGLTQISISTNKKILFIDRTSGLIPDEIIADIFTEET